MGVAQNFRKDISVNSDSVKHTTEAPHTITVIPQVYTATLTGVCATYRHLKAHATDAMPQLSPKFLAPPPTPPPPSMALIFCVKVAKCARGLCHRFRGQGERGRHAVGRPGTARRCEQPKDNCWDMPAGDRRRVRKGGATGERGDRGSNADEPRGKQRARVLSTVLGSTENERQTQGFAGRGPMIQSPVTCLLSTEVIQYTARDSCAMRGDPCV